MRALALLALARHAYAQYFGTAISQGEISPTETSLFSHTVSAGSTHGVLTYWWITGGGAVDDAVFRFYVDGEATASISFSPPLAVGTGFDDNAGPWATSRFGKGSQDGAWFSNLRVPFTKSLNITLQGARAALYFVCRGSENLPISVGGVPVPLPGSRLVLQTNARVMQPLDFLTIASQPAGARGLLVLHTLAFAAGNLNTLEGCHHLMTPGNPDFPGTLVSSGTEVRARGFAGAGRARARARARARRTHHRVPPARRTFSRAPTTSRAASTALKTRGSRTSPTSAASRGSPCTSSSTTTSSPSRTGST